MSENCWFQTVGVSLDHLQTVILCDIENINVCLLVLLIWTCQMEKHN